MQTIIITKLILESKQSIEQNTQTYSMPCCFQAWDFGNNQQKTLTLSMKVLILAAYQL